MVDPDRIAEVAGTFLAYLLALAILAGLGELNYLIYQTGGWITGVGISVILATMTVACVATLIAERRRTRDHARRMRETSERWKYEHDDKGGFVG